MFGRFLFQNSFLAFQKPELFQHHWLKSNIIFANLAGHLIFKQISSKMRLDIVILKDRTKMVIKFWINAHLTFFTNETSHFKNDYCGLVKMLESSMIKALTVNAHLTLYGPNATELHKICEKSFSPWSQTIKPTIQVYKNVF